MDIYIKNPGMPPFLVMKRKKGDIIEGSIKGQQITDTFRSREASLTVPRRTPVRQFAEVRFVKSGKTIFRGFVEQYEIDSKRTKNLTIQGMEKLLECRFMPNIVYPEATTFSELFASTITLNKPPGMLAVANSLLPPGINHNFYDAANNTIQLIGLGTSSRLRDNSLYFVDYKYVKELVSVFTKSELEYRDFTYFRDASDLFVRIDHDYSRGWADYGGVLCENCIDTSIRLGEVPTASLRSELTCVALEDKICDILTDVIRSHDYYLHFRDAEKTLYLDIADQPGRS
jgi:hypothetical protein